MVRRSAQNQAASGCVALSVRAAAMTLSCAKTDCADSNRHVRDVSEKKAYADSEKPNTAPSVREENVYAKK